VALGEHRPDVLVLEQGRAAQRRKMMKRLLAMVVLLAVAGIAHAQVLTYYEFIGGSSSNDWNDPQNWVSLPSIYSPRSSGTPGVLPSVADQVVLRDNVTATVNDGGYIAIMGTVNGVLNGIGAVEYRDPNDPNLLLWAGPASVVMNGGTLSQGAGKVNGRYVIGGVYGGEFQLKGGSFMPDEYLFIGNGGNYTYTGMKDPNGAQDPNYAGITNLGKMVMSGGTFVPFLDGTPSAGGTKTKVKVGYAGGKGTFLMTNGTVQPSGRPFSLQLVVGEGTAPDSTSAATSGYFEMSGGSMRLTENVMVGYWNGKGKMVMTGGSISQVGDLSIGFAEKNPVQTNAQWGTPENRAKGSVSIGGDATFTGQRLSMGWSNAEGTLTVKDTGKFMYVTPATGAANENSIGRSVVYQGGSLSGNGVGVINVQGGSFQFKPAEGNTARGTIRLGWTWDNKATRDPSYALNGIFSRGELNQTGGVVLIEAGGTVASSEQYLVLGSSFNNQVKNNATGIVSVTGGSFMTVGTTTPIYEGEEIIGYARAPVHIILAQHKDTTGLMTIGRNAYVSVDGNFTMAPGNETGALAKLTVDFESLTKVGKLNLTGVATLAGTLTVNTTGLRPREGDKMTVIRSTDPSDVGFSGDFAAITSNITLGLQGGPAFTGAIVSGGSKEYEVTFVGLTAGDANGDHIVDGGDLALMGGNWLASGITWAGGDFTGDSIVDGGDLALMGGDWNWNRPYAPESPLPEPATMALLALGAMAVIRRKR